jgi:hypothetical protein
VQTEEGRQDLGVSEGGEDEVVERERDTGRREIDRVSECASKRDRW